MANDREKRTFRCMYGAVTENPCAFCWHHKRYLTVKQMKRHECLARNCDALRKLENHTYWKQRNAIKARREIRKQRINAYFQAKDDRDIKE